MYQISNIPFYLQPISIVPNGNSLDFASIDDQGQDYEFCDANSIVEDPAKLSFPSGIIQAQAVIEKNYEKGNTEEIVEYYDQRNNIGIAIQTVDGIKAYTYSYYSTNELLLVKGKSQENVYSQTAINHLILSTFDITVFLKYQKEEIFYARNLQRKQSD